MANPTSNFNWQMPTSSDLVTDLPADFETFGQAVDTSLADLKGGTTGQILSKASNTDMDFTWTAANPGDITAVTAGTGITGGGTSGAVTVSFDQANFGGGQYAAGKNKFINGDFGIWQRGTSSTTNGVFLADRWYFAADGSGSTNTVSQQTFTPGTAPVAGYEGTFFWRLARSSAGSGNTYNILEQKIEDVRTFAGQTVTLSYWAKADSARTSGATTLYQNFGSGGSSQVATTISASQSLTTSWTRFTTTFTVPSVSGKTIGTSSYLAIDIGLCFNSASTTDVWGVQLEAGSTATPFQTATGTVQGELAACQRYYWRNTSVGNASNYYCYALGTAYSSTRAAVFFQHPVTMRTAPSFAYSGSIQIVQGSTGNAISAISIDSNSSTQTLLNVTTSSLTTGYGNHMGSTNNTTSFLELSAEF